MKPNLMTVCLESLLTKDFFLVFTGNTDLYEYCSLTVKKVHSDTLIAGNRVGTRHP